MAKSKVLQSSKRISKVIEDCNNRSTVIDLDPFDFVLTDNNLFDVKIEETNNISFVLEKEQFEAITIYNLPFKIMVQNITVPGYSPSNVPPIGIAIIGFNNYIL